ncbi:MAG: type II glyceraldehyde-3-phosphate dehydrogenase [Halobacteriaceae archaeon]
MPQVGVVGYGTIGKRVADAVAAQPDMSVVGVAKTSPNFEAATARERGYDLYAANGRDAFARAGVPVDGEVEDLVVESDVVVDATPAGVGAAYRDLYEAHGVPAIYQGGEAADTAPVSFVARANYDEAVGADAVRVVSCNTTGLSRLFAVLDEAVGVERARVTLVRRGADPGQTGSGPIDDILPSTRVPSHHGPDVQTVLPHVEVDTMAVKVPATLMHVQTVNCTLASDTDADAIRDALAGESRVLSIPPWLGVDGAGKLKSFAADLGRPRGDLPENCVWAESVTVSDRECYLVQAIHQESIVVPENVDAIRAVTGAASAAESVARTDETLGLGGPLPLAALLAGEAGR